MIALIVALLSLVLPLIHLDLSRHPRTRGRVVHVLLLYAAAPSSRPGVSNWPNGQHATRFPRCMRAANMP